MESDCHQLDELLFLREEEGGHKTSGTKRFDRPFLLWRRGEISFAVEIRDGAEDHGSSKTRENWKVPWGEARCSRWKVRNMLAGGGGVTGETLNFN